jgi:hypothetical protein
LEVIDTHRILGLILDRELKCSKKLNLLRHLARTQWRAVQSTLLRIHKMLVLLAVEFGSAAYDLIHNKGLRIALGAFCIDRTQNFLIEAGESTL